MDHFIQALSGARRALITTHVRPDGDALGTSAAMHLGLRQRNIDSHVLLLSHLPRKYAFVFNEPHIPFTDAEKGIPAELQLDAFDCLLVVDTGTWSQLPGLREKVEAFKGRRLVLDHHLTQEDWADQKLVMTSAAAASEIAGLLLMRWGVSLTPAIASALFLGISSDTGWFQFSNITPATLRLAADLMEAGVDTDAMYQHLYQNERPQRVALQTRAQQSLELLCDNRLAVMQVRKQDFQQTGASVADTENLINFPLQIATVEVSVLIVEPVDFGPIRFSFRSKGSIDVAAFAQQFGGGGHARASGLKLELPLDQAHDRVVNALLERLKG